MGRQELETNREQLPLQESDLSLQFETLNPNSRDEFLSNQPGNAEEGRMLLAQAEISQQQDLARQSPRLENRPTDPSDYFPHEKETFYDVARALHAHPDFAGIGVSQIVSIAQAVYKNEHNRELLTLNEPVPMAKVLDQLYALSSTQHSSATPQTQNARSGMYTVQQSDNPFRIIKDFGDSLEEGSATHTAFTSEPVMLHVATLMRLREDTTHSRIQPGEVVDLNKILSPKNIEITKALMAAERPAESHESIHPNGSGNTELIADKEASFVYAAQKAFELLRQDGYQVDKVGMLLVMAQGWNESRFDKDAIGKAGEIGYMQVMPATAPDVWPDHFGSFSKTALADPVKNIYCGVAYNCKLLERFGSTEGMLAAYNRGPTRWSGEQYEKDPMNLAYVKKIIGPNGFTNLFRDRVQNGSSELLASNN